MVIVKVDSWIGNNFSGILMLPFYVLEALRAKGLNKDKRNGTFFMTENSN